MAYARDQKNDLRAQIEGLTVVAKGIQCQERIFNNSLTEVIKLVEENKVSTHRLVMFETICKIHEMETVDGE